MIQRVLRAASAPGAIAISIAACSIGVGLCTATQAAEAAQATSAPVDLSGFWELSDSSRHFTPADLTEAGKQHQLQLAQLRASGRIIPYASRWCQIFGLPFMMGQSPPIDIVQAADEVGIYSEQTNAPRHIYLDGRSHPPASAFVPSTNGHSVGHWEGNDLIVDTVDFSSHGYPDIPGGGVRGPNSHLIEDFKLLEGGQQLQVTFTWIDPTMFLKPHSYYFVYHKLPPGTRSYEDICDASDATPYEHSGGVGPPAVPPP